MNAAPGRLGRQVVLVHAPGPRRHPHELEHPFGVTMNGGASRTIAPLMSAMVEPASIMSDTLGF